MKESNYRQKNNETNKNQWKGQFRLCGLRGLYTFFPPPTLPPTPPRFIIEPHPNYDRIMESAASHICNREAKSQWLLTKVHMNHDNKRNSTITISLCVGFLLLFWFMSTERAGIRYGACGYHMNSNNYNKKREKKRERKKKKKTGKINNNKKKGKKKYPFFF